MILIQRFRREYLNASRYPASLAGLIEAMRQACARTRKGSGLFGVVYDGKRYRVIPAAKRLKGNQAFIFVATAAGAPNGSEADDRFFMLQTITYFQCSEKYLAMAQETEAFIEALTEQLMQNESFPPVDPFDRTIKERNHYADQYFCNLLMDGEVLAINHPQAAIFVAIERFIERKLKAQEVV